MFKLIGFLFRTSLFVIIVLVASHFLKWNGKTVSDQVRTTLSSAEKSPALKSVTKKSKAILYDAKDAAERAINTSGSTTRTEILPEDKAELQALIHSESDQL